MCLVASCGLQVMPKGGLPIKKKLWKRFLKLTLVEKILVMCVQPTLANYMSITCTFDLWMFTIM